eukprot:GHVT01023386.1.p2 GENE.GHVT01023386.1~~GHVT01023386.1.p2  ORF type:complete len:103 (+),score=9.97 GHVT01023386.1:399-707(+)
MPASKMRRSAQEFSSAIIRSESVIMSLSFFSCNEWIFKMNNLMYLHSQLRPEEQLTFQVDPKTIDWRQWHHCFFYGLARWILDEHACTRRAHAHTRASICTR